MSDKIEQMVNDLLARVSSLNEDTISRPGIACRPKEDGEYGAVITIYPSDAIVSRGDKLDVSAIKMFLNHTIWGAAVYDAIMDKCVSVNGNQISQLMYLDQSRSAATMGIEVTYEGQAFVLGMGPMPAEAYRVHEHSFEAGQTMH